MKILIFISELIKQIPDSISGAFIGALVAVLCMWMQNRHSLKLAREEREHALLKTDLDRQLEMKRDIYFKALEGIGMVQNYLFDFINKYKLTNNAGELYRAPFSLWTNVYIVGSVPTMETLDKIQGFYIDVYLKLINDKIPIEKLESKINLLKMNYDYFKQKQDELITRLKEDFKNITDELMSQMDAEFKDNDKNMDNIMKETDVLQKEIFSRQIKLYNFVCDRMKEFGSYVIEMYKNIREELKLEGNSEYWKKYNPIVFDSLKDNMNQLFKKAEENVT